MLINTEVAWREILERLFFVYMRMLPKRTNYLHATLLYRVEVNRCITR